MVKIKYIFIITYLITISGCAFSTESSKLLDTFVNAFRVHVLSKLSPPPESPAPKPGEVSDVVLTEDHRQVAAEFVKEMVLVVLERELSDVNEFSKLVNNLEQGGHYEALYNGLIYSQEYRAKEKQVAPISALRRFAEMMAELTLDQKPEQQTVSKQELQQDAQQAASVDSNGAKGVLIEEFLKQGVTQSKYTLKRRLSEELLKTIDLKKEYAEKLATWYAQFAVRLLRYQIDFGLSPRNNTDEYYHYKWALTAGEDRLKWECLNRIHRVMNGSI